MCSAQFRNLRNLRIPKLRCQSRDRVASVRNLETAQFLLRAQLNPLSFHRSYTKVRDVHNNLLHLRRHLQCRTCTLKPPHQGPGFWEVSPTWRNSLPLGLGMGAERSQTCGVPLFKASPSLKVLNFFLLVSSDALTPLGHYIRKLRSRNLEIA